MRRFALALVGATAAFFVFAAPETAQAGFYNRDGCGMYTPDGPRMRGQPRSYNYDPRSWCYKSRGYYGHYRSGYWVPRADMRYRYRYEYRGPLYTYYPAWGY